MAWPLLFGLFVLVTVVLWFLRPWGQRCPQCGVAREPDTPLCRACGWIYEVPGDDDDDYGDEEVVT